VIFSFALLDVKDDPEYNGIVKTQVTEITVLANVIVPLMGICKWPTGHFTEIPRLLPYGSVFWRCHHFDDILLYD